MRKLVDVQETLSYSVWVEIPDDTNEDDIEDAAEQAFDDACFAGDFIDIADQSIQTDSFGLEFVQTLDDPIVNHEYIASIEAIKRIKYEAKEE